MAHKVEKKLLEKKPTVVNAPTAEKKPNFGKKRRCRQEVAKGEEHRDLQHLHLQETSAGAIETGALQQEVS
ncbi:hypothetical protein ACS0TY_021409 [Phlomoides rotata]